jgi:KaiC/GvpD/RAD55 family RecA-like ATPase
MVKARKAAPRTGRPPVAEADRRGTLVRVLTTEAEHEELQQAAASVSMSVSTWVRSVALERARQMAKKARQEERSRQDGEQGRHGTDSD